ncbi:MAG: cytochrome B, partial [Patescibacteria group bacterium]
MAKPKVAIFSMACCAGCALQIVNLEEKILDLVGAVDVVEWQEGLSEKSGGNYDIAIIEGSVITEKEAEELKEIRKTAKIVI